AKPEDQVATAEQAVAVARPDPEAALPGAPEEEAAKSDYYNLLRTLIERQKRYPPRAQRLRQEGTVVLGFRVGEDGSVVSHRIAQSSGFADLDREVERMLKNAQPLPPAPDGLAGERLE